MTLAGIVLAAGAGVRLRPLTGLRPKALCPVDGRPLVDLALDRVEALAGRGPADIAVNAHHLAGQVVAHCSGRALVSVESGAEALGTAGALAALRPWLDGRDALVTNADAYLPGGLAGFADGWDGERCRLLCVPVDGAGDFPTTGGVGGAVGGGAVAGGAGAGGAGVGGAGVGGAGAGGAGAGGAGAGGGGLRYVGACLLPWAMIRDLAPRPSGLFEVLWRDAAQRGDLDLVFRQQTAIDCGTVADYLAANLHASGGRNVVGAGAVVRGRIERCVVWDGAWVGPEESLVDAVRAGDRAHPVTAYAHPSS